LQYEYTAAFLKYKELFLCQRLASSGFRGFGFDLLSETATPPLEKGVARSAGDLYYR
jgi:hypothetical protein